tara:strand:+ start:483 stop:815 length:333 start_codon:yes stop_codon:yes gene_type:complete
MVYVVKNKRIGIIINTPSSFELIDFFEKARPINRNSNKKRCSINRIDEIEIRSILSNNKIIDRLLVIVFLFSTYSLKKDHPEKNNAGQSNSLRSKLSTGNDNTIRGYINI